MCGAPAQTRAGLEKDEDGGDAAGDAKEEAPIDLCGPDADAEEMEWEEAAPPPRQPAGNVAAGGANVIDLCDSDEPAEEEWEDADRPYARAGAGAAGAVEVRLTEDGEEACAVAACTPRKPSQRRANAGDRQLADAVHRTHLLCLFGAPRASAAARDRCCAST